ncbi:hypothetical protein GCM10020331_000120 [Ectobacillus funiculus]
MYKENLVPLDEHQIFLQGPIVVLKWKKNAKNWPVEYVSSNIEENLGYKKRRLFLLSRIKYADIIFLGTIYSEFQMRFRTPV